MRRIAHRPRYHKVRPSAPLSSRARQEFFRTRWTYRRHEPIIERHPLGHGLSFIPYGYRLVKHMLTQPNTVKGI